VDCSGVAPYTRHDAVSASTTPERCANEFVRASSFPAALGAVGSSTATAGAARRVGCC